MAKLLLETTRLSHSFGGKQLFQTGPLRVCEGDRIGIAGPNGAGKTTLLNILSGAITPDEGTVIRHCPITYLRQFDLLPEETDGQLLREFGMAGRKNVQGLSGGEQMRLRLSAAMGQASVLVFADEPTSNLDEEGIRLVCEKLSQAESFLLISHDRAVLDRLCSRVWVLENGTLTDFPGNYSAWQEEKVKDLRRQQTEYEQYIAEKSHLEAALMERKQRSSRVRKAPSRMGNSEARLHKRAATEKSEKLDNARKAIETRLARLEVKERPREQERAKIDFSLTNPPANKLVLRAEGLTFGYGTRLLFENASFQLPRGSKTVLWGPNGCGKTTLLRLIAEGHPSIILVPKAKIGWFCQGFEQLDLSRTVLENAMADAVQPECIVRSILARLLIRREDVDKPAGTLSGGERNKLAFAKLFASPANLLLLDEPTNYLDLPALESLQEMIKDYEGTILLVTHDRAFADGCCTRTIRFASGKLSVSGGGPSTPAEQERPRIPMDRAVLELRLAQVIAQLSDPNCSEKEALEQQFAELLRQRESIGQ